MKLVTLFAIVSFTVCATVGAFILYIGPDTYIQAMLLRAQKRLPTKSGAPAPSAIAGSERTGRP